jgi:hypothetical protein
VFSAGFVVKSRQGEVLGVCVLGWFFGLAFELFAG